MQEETNENFFLELLKFIFIALVIVIPVRLWIAQPFIVSGASMEPTFETGEYLIIDEISYRFREPMRGDVIIFRYPRDPSEFFIKRIIGLPGETVHIDASTVSVTTVDGQEEILSEPYITHTGNGPALSVTLAEDEYFVMGDNRPDSSDSRIWGAVQKNDLIGRAFIRLLPLPDINFLPGTFSFPESAVLPVGAQETNDL